MFIYLFVYFYNIYLNINIKIGVKTVIHAQPKMISLCASISLLGLLQQSTIE